MRAGGSEAASRAGGRPVARVERALWDMETVISRILQLGVLVSAAVIAAGVAVWAITDTGGYPDGRFPTTPAGVLEGVAHLRALAIIQLGLVLLVLTPVFRVGASVLVFARERDRTFTVITGVVFALLLMSLLLGAME